MNYSCGVNFDNSLIASGVGGPLLVVRFFFSHWFAFILSPSVCLAKIVQESCFLSPLISEDSC